MLRFVLCCSLTRAQQIPKRLRAGVHPCRMVIEIQQSLLTGGAVCFAPTVSLLSAFLEMWAAVVLWRLEFFTSAAGIWQGKLLLIALTALF